MSAAAHQSQRRAWPEKVPATPGLFFTSPLCSLGLASAVYRRLGVSITLPVENRALSGVGSGAIA